VRAFETPTQTRVDADHAHDMTFIRHYHVAQTSGMLGLAHIVIKARFRRQDLDVGVHVFASGANQKHVGVARLGERPVLDAQVSGHLGWNHGHVVAIATMMSLGSTVTPSILEPNAITVQTRDHVVYLYGLVVSSLENDTAALKRLLQLFEVRDDIRAGLCIVDLEEHLGTRNQVARVGQPSVQCCFIPSQT
jgi:hypothetical protein